MTLASGFIINCISREVKNLKITIKSASDLHKSFLGEVIGP